MTVGPVNVLLVDDRPEGLLTMEAVLRSAEYNLVSATSGPEALARMTEYDFAVILLDVQMPGMDGFEAARRAREIERSKHTPIIFVTAINKDDRYVLRGYESGAVDYIFKPFDPEILKSKVAIFSDLFRKNQQLVQQGAVLRAQASALKRSEEWRKLLIDSARDTITTASADGRLTFLSQAFYALTGYEPDEWIGREYAPLLHPADLEIASNALAHVITERKSETFEVRLRTKSGEYVFVEASAKPLVENGMIAGALAVLRDVTERKRAEEERKRREMLERSNEELQQFAYICSHDLQEPLRMMASYAQFLSRRYKGKLDGDADEFIDYIVEGAKRMRSLIQDLLDYSRLGQHEVCSEKANTRTAFETAIENLKFKIEESGAKVTCGELPMVAGNQIQIAQLFQNLIGNALKFKAGNRVPEIRVDAEKHNQEWTFRVSDNGIGFEPKFSSHIFQVFKRLHPKHAYEGTGIGLAVCKKVVERHGGKIWAEGEPNRGATFYFTLPCEEMASHFEVQARQIQAQQIKQAEEIGPVRH